MSRYVEIEEALAYFPALLENLQNKPSVEGVFTQFLTDASRMFEADTRGHYNQYSKAGELEERRFLLNRTGYLHTTPIFELDSIKDADDEVIDVELYTHLNNQLILFNNYCNFYHWTKRPVITISAKWGYTCIPEDVKVAVKQFALLLMHNSPISRLNLEFYLEEQFINTLQFSYNRIVAKYYSLNNDLNLLDFAG